MSQTNQASFEEILSALLPEPGETGTWVSSDLVGPATTRAQSIVWDGETLRAALENSDPGQPLRITIKAGPRVEPTAFVNDTKVDINEAVTRLCQESQQMSSLMKLGALRPRMK